jgi:hypothetical protein
MNSQSEMGLGWAQLWLLKMPRIVCSFFRRKNLIPHERFWGSKGFHYLNYLEFYDSSIFDGIKERKHFWNISLSPCRNRRYSQLIHQFSIIWNVFFSSSFLYNFYTSPQTFMVFFQKEYPWICHLDTGILQMINAQTLTEVLSLLTLILL